MKKRAVSRGWNESDIFCRIADNLKYKGILPICMSIAEENPKLHQRGNFGKDILK